jgi:hypothetical protein
VDTLLSEMARQMFSQPNLSWARLRLSMRDHTRSLLPDGLRLVLQQASAAAQAAGETPRLHVHQPAATEWIPWEILEDGGDFLGLQFAIARLPIMPSGPTFDPSEPRRVQRIYSLLGENAFDPGAAGQLTLDWNDTFHGLPGSVQELRYPAPGAGGFPSVDQFLDASTQGDIVHVTCHGDFGKNDSQLFWTLNRYSPLTFAYHITATILRDLSLPHAPLVFGNACFSGAPGDTPYGLAPGFGSICYSRGALAFLGSFAAITQSMAVRFACQFYRRLIPTDGQPGPAIGDALLETKRWFLQQADPDPSYLYYSLYGPAETRFCAG